jgi:hypothetical protein
MVRKRGNTYPLVMRVPARYRAVENRAIVWVALGTDSEAEAVRLAPVYKARQLLA